MGSRRTRRQVLRGLLATGLGGVGGCVQAPPIGSQTPDTRTDGDPPSFAASVREQARTVGRAVRQAVIVLHADDPLRSGTAWFFDDEVIITNSHVIARLNEFTCRTLTGRWFDADVVARADPAGSEPDIAVLRGRIEPPAALEPGSSESVEPEQPVVQVGHTHIGYWVIALGRIVGRKTRNGRSVILTEIPMMRGNSGSPLVTLDGDVIGLTVGTLPKPGRPPSRNPTPSPPVVYHRYPRQAARFGVHLPIETVQALTDRVIS